MEILVQAIVTIICAVAASSGFWAYMQKKRDKQDNNNKLLLGLAHDRIMDLCIGYLQRGDWITRDEYENLHDYLYKPYVDAGGDGAVEKVMNEVKTKLRIVADKEV